VPQAVLEIPTRILDAIEQTSRAHAPREACGLILFARGTQRACRQVACRNLAPGTGRFELDPGALVAAERFADLHGLTLRGMWHSHVDAPAVPSWEDRRNAWEAWSYWILALQGERRGELRTFERRRGELAPIPWIPSTDL
jgi:proteasome lid subunit RPN8/RPN11